MAYQKPPDAEALRDLIKSSGISHKENSTSYVFACPRCGKRDKLYMYRTGTRFVCWVCAGDGFRGRPEFALTELLGIPLDQIRARLYGDQTPQGASFLEVQLKDWFSESEPVDEDASELAVVKWPLDFYPIDHQFSEKGREYLEKRGISLEVAKEYDLRYCPPQQRVVFPISSGGYLFGWQARSVVPHEIEDPNTGEVFRRPKVVTMKGLKKENTLMFADRLQGSDHAVLCEGPIDALKAHLVGGNVASMGKLVSRAQIQLLRNSGIRKLYIGLDPDAFIEIVELAREFADLEVYRITPPPGYHDLGEMTMEQVADLCRNAVVRVNATNVHEFVDFDAVGRNAPVRWNRRRA